MGSITAHRPCIVGLTGLAGSGKSMAARFLAQRGACHLDADQVAREILSPGSLVLAELDRQLAETHGVAVVDGNGILNRRVLRERLSGDPAVARTVAAVTHPAIVRRLYDQVNRAVEQGSPLVVVEAALLLGSGLEYALDHILVITAPPEQCAQRVAQRDGVDIARAWDLLGAQPSQDDLARRASFVVENDGSPQDLKDAMDRLFDDLTGGGAGEDIAP